MNHLLNADDDKLTLLAAKIVMGWEVKTAARKRWITTSRGERLLADAKQGEKIAPGSQVFYVDSEDYTQRIIGGTSWNPAKILAHAWELRVKMTELGWHSEDRLSWFGWGTGPKTPWGYHVWFWDYHLGNRIGSGHAERDNSLAARCTTIAAIATLECASIQCDDIEKIARDAGIDLSGAKGKTDAWYVGKPGHVEVSLREKA
jgi:hypothetical protein